MIARPLQAARMALLLTLCSVCFLDYGSYRDTFHAAPAAWMDVARGVADAPQQYRVGAVRAALWMTQHSPLHLQHAFALIDTASALIAGLVLLQVLARTAVFRRATVAMQWFGAAVFAGLVTFYLLWLISPQKPETLPTTMLVALMLRLWQPAPAASVPAGPRPWQPELLIAAALLALAFVLGWVRADVACLLNAGLFVAALSPLGSRLSLRRGLAVATALLSALLAGAMQLYLMKVAYPRATYGRVKMWQLRPNLVHATRWPPFVLFLLPLAWMTAQVLRRRFTGDAAGLALLLGALLYGLVWVTIGKIDEVRIFLPMALALAPLTVEMAMLWTAERQACESDRPSRSMVS